MPIVTLVSQISSGDYDSRGTVFSNLNESGANFLQVGNIFVGIQASIFLVFNDFGIPAGVKILSAKLDGVGAQNFGATINTRFRTLKYTDTTGWWGGFHTGWRKDLNGGFATRLKNPAGGTILDLFPASVGASLGPRSGVDQDELSMRFTIASPTTLGSVEVEVKRAGTISPSGATMTFIVNADDGAGLPDGVEVLRTETRLVSTIADSKHTGVWDISAPDDAVVLQAGDYHLTTETNYNRSALEFIIWYQTRANFSNLGSSWFSTTRGVSSGRYPGFFDLIVIQISSALVNWDLTDAFTLNDPWTTEGDLDLAEIIQEAVDADDYPEGGDIGIIWQPLDVGGGSTQRVSHSYDSNPNLAITLTVEYEWIGGATDNVDAIGGVEAAIEADIAEAVAVAGLVDADTIVRGLFSESAVLQAAVSVEVLEGGLSATVGMDLDGEFSAEPSLSAKIHLAGE